MSFLFCDLVASTELMMRLGDEASDELRRDIFAALRQPLGACRGVEVKSQGDGLMVAFGASVGDAVRCGVAMQRGIAMLSGANGAPELALRVGVSSGEATADDGDWFGSAVVEAARLCSLAAPGQILVPEHAVAGARLDVVPSAAGLRQLKGFTGDVACSTVPWVADASAETLIPLPAVLDLWLEPAFIGYADELDQLLEGWRRSTAGESAVVLVAGPPHVGRTRLVAEAAARVATSGGTVLYAAGVRGAGTYQVIVDALRRLAVWAPGSMVDALASIEGLPTLVPAFGVRLGKPSPSPGSVEALTTERVAVIVEEALMLVAMSSGALIVFEDLQWADVSSLATLTGVMASSRSDRALVVGTFRETVEAAGGELAGLIDKVTALPHVAVVQLPLFGRDDVAALVDATVSGSPPGVASRLGPLVWAAVGGAAGDVVEAVRRSGIWSDDGAELSDVRTALSMCAPYKGLVSFGPEDAGVFFGRDQLVDVIVERLADERFVAVVGASGSGKSSLLRAGVATASSAGPVTIITPTASAGVGGAADRSGSRLGGLIVDQFEELFTVFDDEAGTAFIDELFEKLDDGRCTWIAIAVRGDFYAQCTTHPRLADAVADHTVLLRPLDRDDLRTMIERPALAGGLQLESGLVDVVVADIAGEPYPLPLMSHALLETWRRRRGNELTVADYHDGGGVQGAIAATAERMYTTQMDATAQVAARELFLRLVEPGDGTPDTRHTLHPADLEAVLGDRADEVLDALVGARLVVADDERVDLAHEALINEWPRLRGWLDDERNRLQTAAHLARAAREWEARGRPDADLYRGARLDAALSVGAGGHRFTPAQQRFIDASRSSRDAERRSLRRTNRRLKRLLVAAAAALVIAVGATTVAVVQRDAANAQRRSAEISRLADDARRVADSEIDLATLLALEAHRLSARAETLGAVKDVLRAQPAIARSIRLPFWTSQTRLAATATDGRLAVFFAGDDVITVTLPTLASGVTAHVPGGRAAAVSPDNKTVAVVTASGIALVDVASGQVGTELPKPQMLTRAVAWIDDRHLVLTGTHGGASLVDLPTGASRMMFYSTTAPAISVDNANHRILSADIAGPTSRIRTYGSQNRETPAESVDVTAAIGDLHQQPAGPLVAIGTLDAGVLLLDMTTHAITSLASSRQSATGVFSPDGKRIATLDSAGTLAVYDASTRLPVLAPVTQTPSNQNVVFFNDPKLQIPSGVVFAADGNSLFVIGTGRALQIDLTGRQPLATAPFGPPGLLAGGLRSDGTIAYGIELPLLGPKEHSTAFDPNTGQAVATTDGGIWGFGPDDSFLVRRASDGVIQSEAPDGRILARSSFPPLDAGTRVSSDDGRLFLSASQSGQTTVVERLPDMQLVQHAIRAAPTGTTVTAAAITDDGRTLARAVADSEGHTRLEVLGVTSGTDVVPPVALSDTASVVSGLAFTPDGRTIAAGDSSGGIGVLRLATGRYEPRAYRGVRSEVSQVFYSPDGASLFAAGSEGTLWWWDTASRQPVGDPLPSGLYGAGADLAVAHLLTATTDGLRLWNVDSGTWQQIACTRAGRNLSRDEWRRYLPTGEQYHTTCPQYPST